MSVLHPVAMQAARDLVNTWGWSSALEHLAAVAEAQAVDETDADYRAALSDVRFALQEASLLPTP